MIRVLFSEIFSGSGGFPRPVRSRTAGEGHFVARGPLVGGTAFVLLMLAACGGPADPSAAVAPQDGSKKPVGSKFRAADLPLQPTTPSSPVESPVVAEAPEAAGARSEPLPSLADLIESDDEPAVRRTWPEQQLERVGLRQIESQHVTLYTDLPPDREVDALPAIFDQAVLQWAAYFDIPPRDVENWRINAFLMRDQEPFAALEMLPGEREIVTGFATKENLWIHEQSTPYYRRHLWLHEGTHAFMHKFLNRVAPGWYMEGLAELLGTHRLENDRLEIGIMPRRSQEVPALGRIELIRRDVDQGRVHTVNQIMQLDNRRALSAEAYAWCWGLATFLDGHPKYRDRFRELHRTAHDADFDERFREAYASDWHQMQAEWVVFATTLDYGYRMEPMVLDLRRGEREAASGEPAAAAIRADLGWQNTTIALQAGTTYRITADGRYQVNDKPKPWWCEPNGITIHYNQGRPLGVLLAALLIHTADGRPDATSFLRPLVVGLETTVTPAESGTLYLRVNDAVGSLHDNHGEVRVEVDRIDERSP